MPGIQKVAMFERSSWGLQGFTGLIRDHKHIEVYHSYGKNRQDVLRLVGESVCLRGGCEHVVMYLLMAAGVSIFSLRNKTF